MKVPDNLIYSVFQYQDERIREELVRKTVEIATGKRVQDISDDPVATFNIMTLKTDIARLSQFSRNRLFADTSLTYIDSTLSKMADRVKMLYAKTLQARNDTNSPDSLKATGELFAKALGFLLGRANERIGENYVFSGAALTTKPFTDSFTYAGSLESFAVQIGESRSVEVFMPGNEVFSTNVYQMDTTYPSPSASLGVSGTMNVTLGNTTTSVDYGRGIWYLTEKVENPDEPLFTYGIDGDLILYDGGMNEIGRIPDYGRYSLSELVDTVNTTFGSANITASLITSPDGTYTVRIEDSDTNNYVEDTSKKILESYTPENLTKAFNTLAPANVRAYLHRIRGGAYTVRLIPDSVSPSLSVSFSGTPLGNFSTLNLFQVIGEVKDKLLEGVAPDESDVAAVRRAYDVLTARRAKVGSVLSQVREEESVQENRMNTMLKQKSDAEEVELSESIMEYTRYRIAYEALMRIVAESRDLTILRYI